MSMIMAVFLALLKPEKFRPERELEEVSIQIPIQESMSGEIDIFIST